MPPLPCVNVGIPEKPFLLHLELCRILPHQNPHGPLQESMARHVESVRQHNMPLLLSDKVVSDQCFAVRGSMVVQQRPKVQYGILQIRSIQFKKACGNKLHNLLFVEAGDCKSSSDGWVNLHTSLENFLASSVTSNKKKFLSHRKFNEEGGALLDPESRPLLSLRYNRGPNVEDRWVRQLREFVSDHEDANTQTILVVHLQRSKFRAKLYNTIKMTCDLALGVQTIFVNDESLKIDKDTEKGAKEFRRNLRLRNPPLLNHKASEMILAIHVSRFSEEAPTHGVDDIGYRPEQFVVTMVSRCVIGSDHCYQTETKLYTKAELNANYLEELFVRFTSRVGSLDKRTVLRSGYLADSLYSDVASVEPNQAYNLEREFETILNTFGGEKRILKAENIAYITLIEDKALGLRDLGNNVATLLDEHSSHKTATATKDTDWVNSDPNSVKIQQVQKLKGRPGVSSSGIIKATFRHPAQLKFEAKNEGAKDGRSLSDSGMRPRPTSLGAPSNTFSRSSTTQSPQRSPSLSDPDSAIGDVEDQSSPKRTEYGLFTAQEEQKSMNGSDSSPAPLTSSLSTKSSFPESPESSPSNINLTHMKILEAAWKDDWLELYNTKWPVPTYLAQRAKECAAMYLSVEDWGENTNSNQAPMPRLPKVHDHVRNTLYHL